MTDFSAPVLSCSVCCRKFVEKIKEQKSGGSGRSEAGGQKVAFSNEIGGGSGGDLKTEESGSSRK